jgi:type I restriction enzyme M protein
MDMPEGYKNFSKTKPIKFEHFAPVVEWWNNRQEINIDGFDKAKRYLVAEFVEKGYNLDLCGIPHEEEEILEPSELIANYRAKKESLNAKIENILAEIEKMLEVEDESL